MAAAEGTASTVLPQDGSTSPSQFFGLADHATLASALLWIWRSVAAGDALAAKFVAALGLYKWNGATVDRVRNNHEQTALASAARTASVNSDDLTNYDHCRATFVIDVTAAAGSPSLVFTIQGKSTLGTDYWTILASAAITGTGQTILRVGPGLTAAANLVANDQVPRVFRVSVAAGTADSVTYSVSCNLMGG